VRAVNIEVKARARSPLGGQCAGSSRTIGGKGDCSRAEVLLQRALSSYLKAFGPDHNLVASLLSGFADL
jgi:hypothetical protein